MQEMLVVWHGKEVAVSTQKCRHHIQQARRESWCQKNLAAEEMPAYHAPCMRGAGSSAAGAPVSPRVHSLSRVTM